MSSTDPDKHESEIGQRSRIVAPAPPAPVPEARQPKPTTPAPATPTEDRSRLRAAPIAVGTALADGSGQSTGAPTTSDSDVVRAGGSMAIATLFSRITGFLRNVMIGAALGPAIASAFNTANTLPNLITEIVLGAVLTSLVVPVLVRAEKEDADRGAAFIRRLLTLSLTLLLTVTVISVVTAPLLTRLMLRSDGQVNVVMSTSFAYLLLPQILFYGIFALFMAVLNTRGIFAPGAWAPVINNVITLAVLFMYRFLPSGLDPHDQVGVSDAHVLLLGLGTTAGVVVQALIMVPFLKKAGVDIRPLWGIDDRLKQFGGMAMAIIVYVAISQAGYIVTTRIASEADEAAPFIYQQAWLLLQVPYGIIGVTLLTAIMPRLSRNAADGDDNAVVGDLTLASKLTFIALIPIVVFFTAFGVPIATGLFAHGQFDTGSSNILGWTLSFSAFTLIPYALVLLHLRVFYAREEVWTPTFIIAGITATKIVLSMASPLVAASTDRVVILLGAANGFGFVAGAVIGAYLLRRKLGPLGTRSVMVTAAWAAGSGIVGAAVAWFTGWVLNMVTGEFLFQIGNMGYLVYLAIVGVVFLIVTGLVLSRSGLPEVQNLGRLFARIPGMGRFIRPNEAAAVSVEAPTRTELTSQILGYDDFNATPVPPPMSAGIVRGPRLVPGAPVSDGRFRLLADHGSVPGARFWQAREQATGREVALVFVDTSGNAPYQPLSPATAAGIASEVKRRTLKLTKLGSPAIAENIEIVAYRSGCLVVADWVQGSSLSAVCESGADPRAAAFAFADLTEAAGAAHDANIPLGLDNRSRIRISTTGCAVLAFPAVLPDSSRERDARSINAALDTLIDAETAPDEVCTVLTQARDLLTELQSGQGNRRELFDNLAASMRSNGVSTDEPVHINVRKESAPKPDDLGGFGSRGYSWKMTALVAIIAFLFVSLVAAATALLTSLLSANTDEAPINPGSIASPTSTAPLAPAVYLTVDSITRWSGGDDASAAADGDTDTTVSLASGDGLFASLAEPADITRVILTPGDTSSATAQVDVYAFESMGDGVPTSTDGGQLVESVTLESSREVLNLGPSTPGAALLIVVTDVSDGGNAELAELEVIGR